MWNRPSETCLSASSWYRIVMIVSMELRIRFNLRHLNLPTNVYTVNPPYPWIRYCQFMDSLKLLCNPKSICKALSQSFAACKWKKKKNCIWAWIRRSCAFLLQHSDCKQASFFGLSFVAHVCAFYRWFWHSKIVPIFGAKCCPVWSPLERKHTLNNLTLHMS